MQEVFLKFILKPLQPALIWANTHYYHYTTVLQIYPDIRIIWYHVSPNVSDSLGERQKKSLFLASTPGYYNQNTQGKNEAKYNFSRLRMTQVSQCYIYRYLFNWKKY